MNFKKITLLGLTIVAIQLLSACNTIEGIGKDVKSAGQTVETAAARHNSN